MSRSTLAITAEEQFGAQRPVRGRHGARRAEAEQGGGQAARGAVAAGDVVGGHLHQQADLALGVPTTRDQGSALRSAANGSSTRSCRSRTWAASCASTAVSSARGEQLQGALADHDLGPEAGHAVGGGARVVEHPHARDHGVLAGDQGEQGAVAVPGAGRLRARGEQHHDQYGAARSAR